MRILIIDDNKLTAELLEARLCAAGHEVVTAGTASEALTRRVLWRPDVVILDVVLPDASGLDLLAQLRQVSAREGLPKVPVVLATGVSGDELEQAQAALTLLGSARLLRKPFDLTELLAVLNEMVKA